MTSPMIDTVRTIPLIVEKNAYEPMEAETEDSGFPFEREERDDDFRSQLDDIAKRHPEFAEHLDGFPFRSDSLGRRRPPRPSDQEFRRFTDRPFGSSRFERFGFPFSSDPFEDEFAEQKAQQPEQPQTKEEEKPKPERGRKQNIQQSNTVDLGQKQEPVNDRNQRSMSAPPSDNRQRFVSSIHIPINREGGMADMGTAQSQPHQQPPPQEKPTNKPTERIIPIHVEGRDEPVVSKHTGPSYSQPQPERVFGQPQPERIFGHSPSHFTQFVNREPRQYAAGPEWHHGFGPEVRQQQKFQQQAAPPQQQKFQQQAPPPQQQQQQKFQQREVPVQKEAPQQHQQQQPQHQQQQPQHQQQQEQEQPPQLRKAPTTPIEIIQSIQKDVSELMGQVETFAGAPRDKQYLYLDEMLTRNLIKLDNVDTQGQENIRQARKEAIKCIEGCIGILEAKAAANVAHKKQPEGDFKSEETQSAAEELGEAQEMVAEKMEVEDKGGEVKEQQDKMEVEVEAKENEPKAEEAPKEETMEVAPSNAGDEKIEVPLEAAVLVEEVSKEEGVNKETTPKEQEVKEEDTPKEVEEKPEGSSQISEAIESKPADEEMKEVAPEESKKGEDDEVKEADPKENAEAGDDKKEKKKSKKKVVKK